MSFLSICLVTREGVLRMLLLQCLFQGNFWILIGFVHLMDALACLSEGYSRMMMIITSIVLFEHALVCFPGEFILVFVYIVYLCIDLV